MSGSTRCLIIDLHPQWWGKLLSIQQQRDAAWQLKHAVGVTWGLKPSAMSCLYTSVVPPVILYGSVVWWTRAVKDAGMRRLDRLQRLALRMVSSCFPTTPTRALEYLLDVRPLCIAVVAEAMNGWARMMRCGYRRTGGHHAEIDALALQSGVCLMKEDVCQKTYYFNRSWKFSEPPSPDESSQFFSLFVLLSKRLKLLGISSAHELLSHFIDTLVAYTGMLMLQASECNLLVLAVDTCSIRTVASTRGSESNLSAVTLTVRDQLRQSLRQSAEQASAMQADQLHKPAESLIPAALVKSLCFVNHCCAGPNGRPKTSTNRANSVTGDREILILKISDDTTGNYMSLMNSFFTAQKLNTAIDCCLLLQKSVLMEQAADITGGSCIRLPALTDLMQFMTTMFLPSRQMRPRLKLPRLEDVDYRPACFCHQRLIDIGFVCSVCLSVFCSFKPICPTCETVFKFLPLPPRKKK